MLKATHSILLSLADKPPNSQKKVNIPSDAIWQPAEKPCTGFYCINDRFLEFAITAHTRWHLHHK